MTSPTYHVYLCSGTDDWNFLERFASEDTPVIYCDYIKSYWGEPERIGVNADYVLDQLREAEFAVEAHAILPPAEMPRRILCDDEVHQLQGDIQQQGHYGQRLDRYRELVDGFSAQDAWGLRAEIRKDGERITFYYLCVEALALLSWLSQKGITVSGLCLVNQGDGLGGNWAGDDWPKVLRAAITHFGIRPDFLVAQPSWIDARNQPFPEFVEGEECPDWVIDGALPHGVGENPQRVCLYQRVHDH